MTRLSLSLSDLCCCERLALWSIRCLVSHYRLPNCPETKTTDGLFPACFRPALDAAEGAFADATYHLRLAERPLLTVNAPGMQSLTPLEERFLKGIVAAQNEGQREVFVILAEAFPDRFVQGCLAMALTLLADCLAGAGHWLPRALVHDEKTISGGGALSSISRWRSVSPSRMRVLWPQDNGPLGKSMMPETDRVMH
ncbi:hypothetical protein [Gluconobacter kanchanaburiensis]|uniref:Uncharacterized protein n=1 Tax=Gluconobacter kanchanaburiensis NBRC 103587 TaxID=1307948 RepID=A0A511B9X0_9PROT|nr:hypothetical protein [Gluconobacter kanchanaburiensis]GBR70444.1 hypothetical protein AA103587_1874 [Gluconobacter kanchanaburiensis NBRC 103587]GEK97114.1 hypothetical protein GKA01_23110 [Gluconobacter kanchanaburiensis NBRC 103587]